MDFIREINAFERWLRTNYLPLASQMLWYKLFMLSNSAGWPEWVVVPNAELMALIQIENKNTFIAYRDKLIDAGLIEYQKGKKGSPNRYKLKSLLGAVRQPAAYAQPATPPKTTYRPKTPAKQAASYDISELEALIKGS